MTEPECERPMKDGVLGRDSEFKESCPTTSSSDSSDSDVGEVGLLNARGDERR